MKLTIEDMKLLKKNGFLDKDMYQIEEATRKTVYETNDKKITQKEALEILGREEYLSGISRSAFHWSAVRDNSKGESVYFNSRKLFE